MDTESAFEVAQAVLLSLGGGSVIVLGLSSYLGKLWADRLMEKDRAKHEASLTKLTQELKKAAEHENHLLRQKIELYKEASYPVIELVTKALHQGSLSPQDLKGFDEKRLSTIALLAMFAPQEVFDRYNHIIDYIYNSIEQKENWSFPTFREKALEFLSEIRRDIGLHKDEISYKGTR